MVVAERFNVGILLQHFGSGPATEKAQSSNQVFDFRTSRWPLTSDHRLAPALTMDTPSPRRSMILGISAQHHEDTCRRVRQVYSRYGTDQWHHMVILSTTLMVVVMMVM